MIALDHPWYPASINYVVEFREVFHNGYEGNYYHNISAANAKFDHYQGTLVLITMYFSKDTFNEFIHMKSNFICIGFPILSGDYSTNKFSSSNKVVKGHWCDQVLSIKKSLFCTDCGTSTAPLICIDTSISLDKNSHVGYSAYDIFFGVIPGIIQFVHYTQQ